MLEIIGPWRHGRVARWRFGPLFSIDGGRLLPNVKVLPDGRVTKLYRG